MSKPHELPQDGGGRWPHTGFRSVQCEELEVGFTKAPGADCAPAHASPPGGVCPCPHDGYVLKGTIRRCRIRTEGNNMPRYLLIALNSPTQGDGDEVEFNDWYDNIHKADLLSVDGAQSVRRFRVIQRNRIDKDYVSLTEIEAENPDVVMQQLAERASEITDKMDRTSSIFVLAEELNVDDLNASS